MRGLTPAAVMSGPLVMYTSMLPALNDALTTRSRVLSLVSGLLYGSTIS
jgi:hypothetical protein